MKSKYKRVFKGYGFLLHWARVLVVITGIGTFIWTFLMARLMSVTFTEMLIPNGIGFGLIFAVISTLIFGFGFGMFKYGFYSYIRDLTPGKLKVPSGILLVGDPLLMGRRDGGMQSVKLPPGEYPVQLTVESLPRAESSVRASLQISQQSIVRRRHLADLPVVSFISAFIDQHSFDKHFQLVGPDRIGLFSGPGHRQIAEKLQDKLELELEEENSQIIRVKGEVSPSLENGIMTFLSGDEKKAFTVITNNTFDRIAEKIAANYRQMFSYVDYLLDSETGENLIAVTTNYKTRVARLFTCLDSNGEMVRLDLELS
ncbi:MAG: hypothetical protein FH749_13140 [Firmicutes bacterium]|nr:hypothetical protein [Bacillota bacterium]